MRYQLWNKTIGKWVLDEDGKVCVLHSQAEADLVLARLNDIKQLNPDHKYDEIEIRTFGDTCTCDTHKACQIHNPIEFRGDQNLSKEG